MMGQTEKGATCSRTAEGSGEGAALKVELGGEWEGVRHTRKEGSVSDTGAREQGCLCLGFPVFVE